MKPPHRKAKKEKEFRKILKRQRELIDAIHKLGFIKLEKPIRHGWFKEILITEEVERYKQRHAIKEVYKKIKSSYWGATKEKAQQAWDSDRSQYLLSKDKPTISKRQFHRLSEKAKSFCIPFRYRSENTKKYRTRFYVNLPVGCTKIKFTRAYITHQKRIDPMLESELAILNNQLLKPMLYELKSRGVWNKWNRMTLSFERKNESHRVKESLSTFRNKVISNGLKENISWEIN